MIFVTVGTTPFEGLVKKADSLDLKDVLIQRANGRYTPQNHKCLDFSDKFEEHLSAAEVVVTHGGAGTIFKLLEMKKRIVGVANEERSDLHQWDLLKKLSEEGYLIWCRDIAELETCIAMAREKEFKKYTPPKNSISQKIIKEFS
jgi:beta-1,4-N-acetylglucosaminyltransferase